MDLVFSVRDFFLKASEAGKNPVVTDKFLIVTVFSNCLLGSDGYTEYNGRQLQRNGSTIDALLTTGEDMYPTIHDDNGEEYS